MQLKKVFIRQRIWIVTYTTLHLYTVGLLKLIKGYLFLIIILFEKIKHLHHKLDDLDDHDELDYLDDYDDHEDRKDHDEQYDHHFHHDHHGKK